MGEIVLSTSVPGVSKIIDGQQRITTLTLILIYLLRNYKNIPKFPASRIEKLIYSDDHGEERFNLDIEDRREVMYALYKQGEYVVSEGDKYSIKNLVDRYNDIEECWNSEIDELMLFLLHTGLWKKLCFQRFGLTAMILHMLFLKQ